MQVEAHREAREARRLRAEIGDALGERQHARQPIRREPPQEDREVRQVDVPRVVDRAASTSAV